VLALPADTKLMILAPLVVGNRKGEQLDLFRTARPGFRARAGRRHGVRIDAVPKLAKNKKHTVEVVVDRLKVRDAKQRLAESFETALRHAEGRAIAVEMDATSSTCSRPSSPARSAATRCRTGAAPVLVQQPDGRLPEVRRPRRSPVLRPGARGRLPASVAGRRRDQGLGQAQPVLFPDVAEPADALRLFGRHAVEQLSDEASGRSFSRLRQGSDQLPLRQRERHALFDRSHSSKASSPIWNGATGSSDSTAVREELSKYISNNRALPGLRRHPAARRSAPRAVGGVPI
jgi:excinuclease ABC subunit A